MDKPLTSQESQIVDLIRKLQFGQIVIYLEAGKIIHVERKESIKV